MSTICLSSESVLCPSADAVGGGIEVQGRTSVGRGTGAVGEAFRAPEMKDAGGGARAGRVAAKALEAPVKGGAEGGAGRIAEVFVAPTKKGT